MLREWRDVPDCDGYQVSSDGLVRSLDRTVPRGNHFLLRRGQLLKPATDRKGYAYVHLRVGGQGRRAFVHQLVACAFIGPQQPGIQVCHSDGDPKNNSRENLRYGTPSENQLDRVRHGRHHHAIKTACKNGHEFTPENTKYRLRQNRVNVSRVRDCVACDRGRKERLSAERAARRAQKKDLIVSNKRPQKEVA